MVVLHDQAVRFLSFVRHDLNLHYNLKRDSDVTRRFIRCSGDKVAVVKTTLSLGIKGLLSKLIFEHTENKMNSFAKPSIVPTLPPSLIHVSVSYLKVSVAVPWADRERNVSSMWPYARSEFNFIVLLRLSSKCGHYATKSYVLNILYSMTSLILRCIVTSNSDVRLITWFSDNYVFSVEIKYQLDSTEVFYCRSYCLLNMFRAPLCPSSGAQEYYTVFAACGFQVAGLVWSWGLCAAASCKPHT